MDKYEYKVRADEIKALISEGKYADALKIADSIDWKRVKSVTMLCTISDLYKINRRFEESKEILLLAYERYPDGRSIVYSLCELSIKMGEFVQAVEYYKEFVRIAPRDTGRYILQYKLYEAQDVSLEERIAVLEELKKHDYREKWAYQLAYLYHRVGLATECIEECDEMYLWFGEGKYVMKALELKMLHTPLSEEQQASYTRYKAGTLRKVDERILEEEESDVIGVEESEEIQQPTRKMYDDQQETSKVAVQKKEPNREIPDAFSRIPEYGNRFDTINLQKAIAESMKEIMGDLHGSDREMKSQNDQDQVYNKEKMNSDQADESFETEELFKDQTEQMSRPMMQELFYEDSEGGSVYRNESPDAEMLTGSNQLQQSDGQMMFANAIPSPQEDFDAEDSERIQEERPGAVVRPSRGRGESHFDNMLAQDYDGQISLVVPEDKMIEKQITGQISIGDIMTRIKKEQQERQMREVRQRVADETSDMFAAFDEKAKADLQIRIEKAVAEALRKEREKKTFGENKTPLNSANVIVPDGSAAPYVLAGKMEQADSEIQDLDPEENLKVDISDLEKDISESENAEDASKEESMETNPSTQEASEREDIQSDETVVESSDMKQPSSETETETETETEAENGIVADQDAGKENTDGNNTDESVDEQPERELSDQIVATEDGTGSKETISEEKSVEEPITESDIEKTSEAEENDQTEPLPTDPETKEMDNRVRVMTPEEKELFGPYIHHRKSRRQIIRAIDSLSITPGTNNAIVSGAEGAGTISLAKGLIRSVQASDPAFSGKVAKITAEALNHKSVESIVEKLSGGALIVQRATDMKSDTILALQKALQQENRSIIVILEDSRTDMDRMLKKHPELKESFNVRVDIEALDDDALVAYAKQYALEKEYTIDNFGILALHTRIEDMQTLDHEVTISEVKDIVDDAIYYADKRSAGHFFDILFNKRYDEEDMIILREKDFMH